MQYALLIYSEELSAEAERPNVLREYGKLTGELRSEGKLLAAEELQPVATATSVQVRDGDAFVTDGPFAETKEALGGFFLIEADSLDEAIDCAGRIPSARYGTIEVRPVVDHSGGTA